MRKSDSEVKYNIFSDNVNSNLHLFIKGIVSLALRVATVFIT